MGAAEIHPLAAATCKLHHGTLGWPDFSAAHAPHTSTPRFVAAGRHEAPDNPGELGPAFRKGIPWKAFGCCAAAGGMLGRLLQCRVEGVVCPEPGMGQDLQFSPLGRPAGRIEDGIGSGVDVPRQPPLQGDFNGLTGALEDAAPGM
jgi:hypothetical protein